MENQKIVAVWLTRAERGDEKIRERLRALRAEYKPKKYTVCEYHSGDGDLKMSVLDLLEYNKLRSAEREIEQEKAARSKAPPPKTRPAPPAQTQDKRDGEMRKHPRGAMLPGDCVAVR